jgi:hypothetical protein
LIRLWPIPSKSVPIHHSPIIIPFNTILIRY